MKVLIFNGAIEPVVQSTSAKISTLLKNKFDALACETEIFNITDSNIPLFKLNPETLPAPVEAMNKLFRATDIHIWITPLYHGGMTGAMKNCLDWLEYGKTEDQVYLEGKVIGFACWAGGVQAINGINAMDTVAKALRAWTAPLSVPMQYADLYTTEGDINPHYQERLELLAEVVTQSKLG